MLNNTFTKTLYEKRWMILGWSLAVAAMSLLMMGFFHSFNQGGLDELYKNIPKSLQDLVGDPNSLKTVPGYVSQQVFALRIPLLTLIMSIILFAGLLAGDESNGTLQTLLAQPISRTRVYVHKFVAGMLISLLVCLGAFIGVVVGLTLINEDMSLLRLLQAVVSVWVLVLLFGTLGYVVGAITGKHGLAGSLTGCFAFTTYLLTSFIGNVKGIAMIERISPFHFYNRPSVAEYGLNFEHLGLMIAVIASLFLAGLVVFRKRDIYQR